MTETKTCRNCRAEFAIEPDDFGFYERMNVPAPTWCPECRFKRRAVWRNETTLYNRVCDKCQQSMVSMYNPKLPYVIYCAACWYSDAWDPKSYGKDYDPSRPFLEQLAELSREVPKINLFISLGSGPNVRSEYTNFAGGNKDCYLIFNSGPNNENCAYSRGLMSAKDTFDTYFGEGLDRVYDSVDAHKCSEVAWGSTVSDCLNSYLMLNCTGCSNCFGCVNLRHGSYMFFNEQLSPEEWKRTVGEILGSYSRMEEAKKRFRELADSLPCKENHNFKSIDSTGDYLFECKNCDNCFEVTGGENLKYIFSIKWAKDCYDMLGHTRKSELLYEGVATGWSTRVTGSWSVDTCQNVEYSLMVRSSKDCFGCDGVKNGQFVILNKQYSEEEYKAIREKIVGEMRAKGEYGEYFPISMAPFAYNETLAQDNFPLTREEALAQGFRWEDDIQMTKGKETLRSEDIPDHIKDIPDTITNEVLACVECERNYRIIPAELAFYRRMTLPLPRKCFYCRHQNRIRRRGPMKIFDRECAKCAKAIKTTYSPDRPGVVYCESCYQAEVA